MNAAVMTTGPGVMSPIATASRNSPLVSQWCCVTTPSLRKGTIARPLPKMKAPAFRKNSPSATSVPAAAVPISTLNGTPTIAAAPSLAPPRLRKFGGASRTIMSRPAATKSTAISAPVSAVTAKITSEIARDAGPFGP